MERLCRFKLPKQPQCGHGDCLREKVGSSTPAHRAQNEMADGTSTLVARNPLAPSSFFARHCLTAGLGSEGFEKKQDGADGTSATLGS
jgi:hypothetical protein